MGFLIDSYRFGIPTPWYDSNWGYRVPITIQSSQVNSTLTNFPVYVDLSTLPAGFFTNVKSDGSDIRVTTSDMVTELPREVVFITPGSSIGEMHFKADSVSASSDTTFYIYYGNAGASEPAEGSTYGKNNVWDSNYVSVWHLDEVVNNTTNGYDDSTSNANDGTGVSMALTEIGGKLASKAQNLDGASDYIGASDSASFDSITSQITISGWVRGDTWTANSYVIDKQNRWSLIIRTAGTVSLYGLALSTAETQTTTTLSTGVWYYLTATYNSGGGASNAKIYINGALDTSATRTNDLGTDNNPVRLGMYSGAVGSSWGYDGGLDEIRVSNIARSTDWISAEYTNQNTPGTFYSVGVQEVG